MGSTAGLGAAPAAPPSRTQADAARPVGLATARRLVAALAVGALGLVSLLVTVSPARSETLDALAPSEPATTADVDTTENATADGTAEYGLTATSTGDVTVTGAALVDPSLPGGVDHGARTGQAVTATARHTLTQAGVDSGSVVDHATGQGTTPEGRLRSDPPGTKSVTLLSDPGLSTLVQYDGELSDGARPGDRMELRFVVQNTGDVGLTDVVLTSPMPGIALVGCTWDRLAPGEEGVCAGDYPLTAQDIVDGKVVAAVSTTAKAPDGATVFGADPVEIPVTAHVGPDVDAPDGPAPSGPAYRIRPSVLASTGVPAQAALLTSAGLMLASGSGLVGARHRARRRTRRPARTDHQAASRARSDTGPVQVVARAQPLVPQTVQTEDLPVGPVVPALGRHVLPAGAAEPSAPQAEQARGRHASPARGRHASPAQVEPVGPTRGRHAAPAPTDSLSQEPIVPARGRHAAPSETSLVARPTRGRHVAGPTDASTSPVSPTRGRHASPAPTDEAAPSAPARGRHRVTTQVEVERTGPGSGTPLVPCRWIRPTSRPWAGSVDVTRAGAWWWPSAVRVGCVRGDAGRSSPRRHHDRATRVLFTGPSGSLPSPYEGGPAQTEKRPA